MSFQYKNYTLCSYLQEPWYSTEISLFEAILDKLPDSDKTYVSTQHYHARLAQPLSGADVVIVDDLGKITLPGLTGGVAIVDGNHVLGTTGSVNAFVTPGLDAAVIGTGIVSTIEFERLDGVTSNIQTQIDAIIAGAGATGAQGLQGVTGLSGSLGLTGATSGVLPVAASDGKLIDSNYSETGAYNIVEGTQTLIRRTDGTSQYAGAQLNIMRDNGTTGMRNFEQTRLSFVGRDSVGNSQSYGSIRAYCTDPTNGSEAGTVSIDIGDSDAEQERLRITRFGGIQAIFGHGYVVGDPIVEWTTNQCIAFGIPTGAQSGTWENDEIGMGGRMFVSDVTDGGATVEGLSNKTSADTALTLIGRCVTTPGSVGAVAVDACTQSGTSATATGIASDSALLAFKNGGTLKPIATVWGDGDIGEKYKDIFSSCTFGNGLTGISGYIGAKKIGRTAFFNVWLTGSHTGPLTKTIELPEEYRACTGMPQAFFSHNCANGTVWGSGCGYMSSYLEKKVYLTSTPNPNQGNWTGGGFATQFQFFSECQV